MVSTLSIRQKYAAVACLSILVTLSHFLTPLDWPAFHDVFRRFYYLPIFFAASFDGRRGGLLIALLCALCYAPHIIFQWEQHSHMHAQHAGHLNKYLEILIFLIFGALFGTVFDRLREAIAAQRRSYEASRISSRLAALGQLSAGLAHEIRTPLTGILSCLDLIEDELQKQPSTQDTEEFINLAKHEIERADSLLRKFLNFAKPTTLERQPTDFRDILKNVQQLVELPSNKKSLTLDIEALPQEVIVNCDPAQIIQALLNLSLNAIQAVPEMTGRISISTSICKHQFNIQISDNGPGISPENLDRIFDPFFTTRPEGVGLGLAICYQIVQLHKGQLNVQSTSQGTVMTLSLPLDLGTDPNSEADSEKDSPAAESSQK